MKRLALILALIATPLSGQTIAERDIKAAATALNTATTLDVDKYNPQAPLTACTIRRLPHSTLQMPSSLAEALQAVTRYSVAQKGHSLMVLRNGTVLHENYAAGVDADRLLVTASMMKSVVGLLTGIAIEKRLIKSVDDPVSRYVVEWKDDPRGKITVRQLLTMTSGLKLHSFSDPNGESLKLLLSTDVNGVALRHPLQDKPGSIFRYNNANSQIVGLVIDRQARKYGYADSRDFMQKEFWCPIGNGNATLWIDREGGSPRYYSGLNASTEDWARIGELIRNKGRVGEKQIVPASWMAQMNTPSARNRNYGLQIWLGSPADGKRRYSPESMVTVPHSAPYQAKDVLFFDGIGGQRVYVVPSKGITIVRTGLVNLAYDDAVIVNTVLSGLEQK